MPDRSSLTDESVLMRWMKVELNKINEGIVAERKSLSVLLTESTPLAKTRGGKELFFDVKTLRFLEKELPGEIRKRLTIPILFYSDMEVPDSCYVADEIAVKALQILGEISPLRTMQNGKLWVSRPIVYALMGKYPTTIQLVMG